MRKKASQVRELIVLSKESQHTKEQYLETKTSEFNLTEFDKITYSKAIDDQSKILEVVNVSYEIKIKGNWITIWRYDSEHGFLHCHMRMSLSNPEEAVTTAHVIKKGTPHKWLTWAIDDIKDNYLQYRRGFMKRSKLVDITNE